MPIASLHACSFSVKNLGLAESYGMAPGLVNPHKQALFAQPVRARASPDSPALAHNWLTLAHAGLHDVGNQSRRTRTGAPETARSCAGVRANFSYTASPELRLETVRKVPEAPETGPYEAPEMPTETRFCSVQRPNPRPEGCSNPFSDSLLTEFSEVRTRKEPGPLTRGRGPGLGTTLADYYAQATRMAILPWVWPAWSTWSASGAWARS
jgi:hypothetical protein